MHEFCKWSAEDKVDASQKGNTEFDGKYMNIWFKCQDLPAL